MIFEVFKKYNTWGYKMHLGIIFILDVISGKYFMRAICLNFPILELSDSLREQRLSICARRA